MLFRVQEVVHVHVFKYSWPAFQSDSKGPERFGTAENKDTRFRAARIASRILKST